LNLARRNSSVASVGREYIHDTRPSANMFLERSASFLLTSYSASAAMVRLASGTGCTW
jgi:hypothetical protein